METPKPKTIPRPENDLPVSDPPVVRPTAERVISRVDSRPSSVAFDNAVLMNMGEGMYTVDTTGAVTSMNRTAEILFGWTFGELVGRNMHGVTHHKRLDGTPFPAEECAGFQVLKSEKTLKDHDDVFIRKDGTFFDVIYSSSPIRENGEIKGLVVVFRDVTERNQTLAALRESEERFRLAQQAGNVGVWDWNVNSGQTYWSETMWHIYDVEPQDINPDEGFWLSRVHPEDRESAKHNLYKIFDTADERHTDMFRVVKKDGEVRWVESIATIERDDNGKALRMYGVDLDITERKNIEDRIWRSENQLRVVTNSVPALISYIDKERRYRFVNDRYTEWFGKPAHLIEGKHMREVLGTKVYRILEPKVEKVLAGKPCSSETSVDFPNAGTRFVQFSYTPDISEDGEVKGFYVLVSDLTETKRVADELQRAHDELEVRVTERTKDLAAANDLLVRQIEERAIAEEQRLGLLRRLFTVQEDERARIARDIHDQLGQRLTALRLKIASLKDMSTHEAEVAKRINRLQEIAEHLDSEVSFLAWEMRPSILDQVEFVTALENYVKEWSRHSEIFAEFDSIGMKDIKFDADLETNLYRILQEALNNAAKHAKASRISVLLEKRGEQLLLIIEDNGVGFDTAGIGSERDKGKGFGLFGMRERASLVHGTIEIESSPNKGTSIFVRVPIIGE